MRAVTILAVCLGVVVQECRMMGQVPHVLTYQGRVTSGGTNFSGTGQFKFALVSGGTSASAPATGSATVSFGFVVHIAVTSAGAGYTAVPAVTITDSTGSGASAVAQIANGQVVGITVTDAGSGYSASPAITIAPPAMNLSYTTYWSHDGTSSAGGEPATFVPVSVSQGLFTVGLGDTMIPSMAALAPQVFANSNMRLRIWFNDGMNGFHQLNPDQRLTSAAYAMMADTVRDGAITAAQIAPGSITSTQLADGTITSAKLAPNVNLGPPRGSILMSTNATDTNLIAAGYVRIPSARVQSDEWEALRSSPAIAPRQRPSSVWTGTEMIAWGGSPVGGGTFRSDGGRYNPGNNTWTPLPTNNAPYGSDLTKSIWTGGEMIVWGAGSQGYGGIYNLQSNTWRAINPQNAPTPTHYDQIFWTGTEMLVWNRNGGGRFNPVTGVWSPISQIGAPTGEFVAAWSGTELLVWQRIGAFGASYSPSANVWLPLSTENGPQLGGFGFWTGSEFVVFSQDEGRPGAKFDRASNIWTPISPSGYYINSCAAFVRTGTKVYFEPRGEGDDISVRVYDLEQDNWTTVYVFNGPNLNACDVAYHWTGKELLLYGGGGAGQVYRWNPAPPRYLYQKQ